MRATGRKPAGVGVNSNPVRVGYRPVNRLSIEAVIQTILAHLKQRAPPEAVRRQTPAQGPQNDLFTMT